MLRNLSLKNIFYFLNVIVVKYFPLVLFLTVLASYGQILEMYVWQDDNGLFFKLAHIEERAGYLGPGPFGGGAYKYIATPYIPIHTLFSFNTVPYFALNLLLYFLTSYIVYKIFSSILGISCGRLVGFLFAAGYIASDGLIRLFNSPITSLSIIFISVMLLSYWNFFKFKNLRWYILALFFFFLATEFARGRTHYLISVVLLFELLFLAFEKPVKSLLYSALRLIPFIYIFYLYFVSNADQRSGQVKNLFVALSHGEFYQLYSFITSFLNVIVPDWIFNLALIYINLHILSWVGLIAVMLFVIILLRNHTKKKLLIPIFYFLIFLWKFLSKDFFSTEILNLMEQQMIKVFFGGLLLILVPVILLAIKKYKKIYLFLTAWAMFNIAAYAAYNPTVNYESVNRYLAHSFFAWVGILGVFYLSVEKFFIWKKITLALIIFWGIGNIFAAIFYQYNILQNRSNPSRIFYTQLKSYLPQVSKGDVLYFDVASNAQGYFQEAFSVASMPETTALAWRYGIDRYDIKLFTEFNNFAQLIKLGNVRPEKIHTFWYSKAGLFDTSTFTRAVLFKKNESLDVSFDVESDQIINLKNPISGTVPVELSLDMQASFINPINLSFPFKDPYLTNPNEINKNPNLRLLALNYVKVKELILKNANYQSSSQWRERKLDNLHDQNPDTIWQADRVLWQKRNENFTIDIGSPQQIEKFVWINGFANNTPTKYQIEVSVDGKAWRVVKKEDLIQRVETKDPQIIEFDPQFARYFRMVINQTLGGDSPAIAEAWVVPYEFKELNIVQAESFVQHPFSYVDSTEDYKDLLSLLENNGTAQVYWYGNKKQNWQTEYNKKINLVFDGVTRTVKEIIPAGGTMINKIKISNISIPSKIIIRGVKVRYLGLDEYAI